MSEAVKESTTRARLQSAGPWLLAPATEQVPRGQAVASVVLRMVLGLLWLYNVSWKRPPDFGQDAGSGLYKFTAYAVSHPVFAPYSWLVEHVVLKLFTPFGWLVLIAETSLAIMLLTGAWVRLAAVVGVAQSAAIGLSVANAPNEWPWSYILLVGAHVVILFSSAGRLFAIDAVRAGLPGRRTMGMVWGGVTALMGALAVLLSLGDPFAPRGHTLGSDNLEIGLGSYNLAGGLVLVLAGVLLLLASRGGPRWTALAAVALGVVAGVSLHVQLGFTDPFLGGTASSAAFFLCVAAVAAGVITLRPPSEVPVPVGTANQPGR